MGTPKKPTRAVSILGHPVSGLGPIVFLSLGWILLGFEFLPRLRRFLGETIRGVDLLDLASLWPLTPKLTMFGGIALGSLLLGIVLFVIWVRSAGGFGPLSDRLLSRTEPLAGLVLVAVGVLTVTLVSPGHPAAGEARRHVAFGWLWHESIRAGTYPLWTDLWNAGFPGAQHIPPLPHLLHALIGFLRFDPFTAAKELAWFCRMAGAIGFALFCAQVHRDRRSGLLGGVLFGLAPLSHADWVQHGDLPGALVLAILPWSFLAAEKISTGSGGHRTGAALALSIGALAMSHAGLARYALILIGVFMLLRSVPNMATRGARAPSIPGVVIGVIGGVALAAGFVVPMVRDAPLLHGAVEGHLMTLAYRFPDLDSCREILRWDPTGDRYLGVSIAFLGFFGIVRAVLDRWEQGRGIGPVPIAVMVLLPWFLIPIESEGRPLLFIGVGLAAAGLGRRPDLPRFGWILRRGIYPIAMLLVLVDLAPISLSTAFRVDSDWEERDYMALRDRMPNGRFLELTVDTNGSILPVLDRYAAIEAVPSVGGPLVAGAPRSFAYQAALIDTVAKALDEHGVLEGGLIDLLALQNIRYLLLTDRDGPILPPETGTDRVSLDREIEALRIEDAAPVAVLMPGIPPAPEPIGLLSGEGRIEPDLSRRLNQAQLAWIAAARPRMVQEARAVVLPNRMEIDLPDLGAVEIRVARNDYPSTEVKVDGRPYPWHSGPLGGVSLVLDAGTHHLEIRGTEEPLRRGLRIGQWALFGVLFLVSVGPRRR